MNLSLECGTFDWNWYPHAWVYRPNTDSHGAAGFAWLFLMVRLDFSREIASRSFIEKGFYKGDPQAQNRPTLEVDLRKSSN